MSGLKEIEEYRAFAAPSELHKAINTLKGIVSGITIDGIASEAEIFELANWCTLHKHLEHRHPFNELIPLIYSAFSDGQVDEEEAQDIVWLCNSFTAGQTYYDEMTSALQQLSGILHGIMADGVITEREARNLSRWLELNDYLRSCYPFDEIDSLLVSVLSDGKLDEGEQEMLMAFFSHFIDLKSSVHVNETDMQRLREQYHVNGICAVAPEIEFVDCVFCFTGKSAKTTRGKIAEIIQARNGVFNNGLTQKTKYLIVGNDGNPCWAYACYGRKIEQAVQMRKDGINIIIVNELDFWDALN